MVRFYTKEFFEEIALRLSADSAWKEQMRDGVLRIVCSAADVKRSFLLDVKRGAVSAAEATPETQADFHFEGEYDTWMRLCKGEVEFEQLVQTGRIRVRGPMPRLMSLFGPLNHIVLTARSFPKEF